ncbi:MAG TPA: hypothetical protein VMZ33_08175 [Candidatus Limnocylindrales bacterium]|nr:hypothetical protein [Candidatus Limnocylindrales bacterium]
MSDYQNAEHSNGAPAEDWPTGDQPLAADDSDAPVSLAAASDDAPTLGEALDASAELNAAVAGTDAEAAIANFETVSSDDAAGLGDIGPSDSVEIRNGGARDIDATTVSITQGGARDIDAQNVTITQGGAAQVHADDLTINQGGVAIARTENLRIAEGGSAFAVVADKATLSSESSVFLLIAGSSSGDVRPVLDWRTAAALGAGFVLAISLIRRLR